MCVLSGSGRSSPYSSQYANIANVHSSYSPTSGPQTYSQSYSQYSSKPHANSPLGYSSNSPRTQEDSGVTYAQIMPRSERPIPGPQVPVQIKVTDTRAQINMQPSPNKVTDSRSPINIQPPNQSRPLPQQPYSPATQQYSSNLPSVQQPQPGQPYSAAKQQYSSNLPSVQQHSPGLKDKGISSAKEQEVDDLTKMLMQGLEGTKDPDFFGK